MFRRVPCDKQASKQGRKKESRQASTNWGRLRLFRYLCLLRLKLACLLSCDVSSITERKGNRHSCFIHASRHAPGGSPAAGEVTSCAKLRKAALNRPRTRSLGLGTNARSCIRANVAAAAPDSAPPSAARASLPRPRERCAPPSLLHPRRLTLDDEHLRRCERAGDRLVARAPTCYMYILYRT